MKTPWDTFFNEHIITIFSSHERIVDFGAGLRALKEKGDRYDSGRSWIVPLIEKVEYVVIDPVSDFRPDIVADIHNLPFSDNSEEAIICLAVLEHVINPTEAVGEIHRSLKPGGCAFFYVPFLFYYHAEMGYYKDYWRFTRDALDELFKEFSVIKTQSVRGAIGTWLHISPFGRYLSLAWLAYVLDRLFGKLNSNQVSGYYVYVKK